MQPNLSRVQPVGGKSCLLGWVSSLAEAPTSTDTRRDLERAHVPADHNETSENQRDNERLLSTKSMVYTEQMNTHWEPEISSSKSDCVTSKPTLVHFAQKSRIVRNFLPSGSRCNLKKDEDVPALAAPPSKNTITLGGQKTRRRRQNQVRSALRVGYHACSGCAVAIWRLVLDSECSMHASEVKN